MKRFLAVAVIALAFVLPFFAISAQAAPSAGVSRSVPVAQDISGGHLTAYNPWNNGGGYICGEAYGYESFTGHDIEVDTYLYYNGSLYAHTYDQEPGYNGAAPVACAYTYSGGSFCWQVYGWMYDFVNGSSMGRWSSCLLLYRHP